MIIPTKSNLIWWTLANKQLKCDLSFHPANRPNNQSFGRSYNYVGMFPENFTKESPRLANSYRLLLGIGLPEQFANLN